MDFAVDGSFSVEVTIPGDQPYSSVKHRAALSIGQVITADSPEEARDAALGFLQELTEDVKLHLVANAPGSEFYTDEHGVGQVGLAGSGKAAAPAVAATSTVAEPTPAPTASADTGQTAAATSGEFQPTDHGGDRYTVLWDGRPRTVFDNRGSKKGNQPDFKMPESSNGAGDDNAFWLRNKNGSINKAAAAVQAQIDQAVAA